MLWSCTSGTSCIAWNHRQVELAPQRAGYGRVRPAGQIIDPAHKDGPTTAEVIAEVNRQKAATQTVIDQGRRLNNTLTQVSTAFGR